MWSHELVERQETVDNLLDLEHVWEREFSVAFSIIQVQPNAVSSCISFLNAQFHIMLVGRTSAGTGSCVSTHNDLQSSSGDAMSTNRLIVCERLDHISIIIPPFQLQPLVASDDTLQNNNSRSAKSHSESESNTKQSLEFPRCTLTQPPLPLDFITDPCIECLRIMNISETSNLSPLDSTTALPCMVIDHSVSPATTSVFIGNQILEEGPVNYYFQEQGARYIPIRIIQSFTPDSWLFISTESDNEPCEPSFLIMKPESLLHSTPLLPCLFRFIIQPQIVLSVFATAMMWSWMVAAAFTGTQH